MTNDFDLDGFLKKPNGGKMTLDELTQKLEQLTQLLAQQQIGQGIERRLTDWKARGQLDPPQSQQQPAPFDVAGANREIDRLSQEYLALSSDPSRHMDRMDELQKKIGELERGIAGQGRADRSAYLEGNSPELDQLGGDINTLSAKLNQLYGDPSKNAAEISRLEGELDQRTARWEQIQAGGETSLEWNGGNNADSK